MGALFQVIYRILLSDPTLKEQECLKIPHSGDCHTKMKAVCICTVFAYYTALSPFLDRISCCYMRELLFCTPSVSDGT
jgi:hypothetical protein